MAHMRYGLHYAQNISNTTQYLPFMALYPPLREFYYGPISPLKEFYEMWSLGPPPANPGDGYLFKGKAGLHGVFLEASVTTGSAMLAV